MRRGIRLLLVAASVGLPSCTSNGSTPDGRPTPPGTNSQATSSGLSTMATTSPSTSTPQRTLPSGQPGRPADVVTGLDVPWSVAALPDGSALISLRDEARIVRVRQDGSKVPIVAPGPNGVVPGVSAGGEGGLLGLAVSPTFATDGFVYSYATTDNDNHVLRLRLVANHLIEPREILGGIPNAVVHNGGRLAFGPDGYLYVATGDAGDRSAAQDRNSLAGKILRITASGEPAPGNPFPGSTVWSLGHRNVQGIGWAADGTMYASEFGQDRLDELNRITPGGNYGWPEVEGSDGDGGFIDPLATWATDESSPSGIAVTADAVYLAALRGERLWRVPFKDGAIGSPQGLLIRELGRTRDVALAPGGDLWVLTSNTFRGQPRAGDDRVVLLPLN